MRKPMIAGNWKMHLNRNESSRLVTAVAEKIAETDRVDVLVAPPFTNLGLVQKAIGGSAILLAAQNMHWENQGAYTGEISPGMLLEAGCTHVILGHSERRGIFKETSEMVDKKAKAAVLSGLKPIVCIGETLEEREAGRTFEVIRNQLDESLKTFTQEKALPSSLALAYEPVWAIGTGKTATPAQAQEVHRFIRDWLRDKFGPETAESIRVLYGGSVKPENIRDLMAEPDIDGALVGGASLKADSFISLIRFQES
ncbi:MAG: triose-phosphate isomerase [Desulfatiglandales bacterium]